MSHYIDGFAFPIAVDRLDEYRALAEAVAEIWQEHGALAYYEYTGDDMTLDGTRSFVDVLCASENETIVLGWVVFESREARDRANEKVATDPRMEQLVTSVDSGFDPERMAYGGFRRFIQAPGKSAG